MEIQKYSHYTYVIKNLLSSTECEELINNSEDEGFLDAPITTKDGPVMRKDIRNNSRVIMDSHELSNIFWLKTKEHLPQFWAKRTIVGLNERFRFYRYENYQQFHWHYDGYYERQNGERSMFTLMFYLNDDFEGGETEFKEYSIKPVCGDALVFMHNQLHRGAPVTKGRKYVIRTDVMYSAL